jgi:hypothetical protein
LAGGQGPHPGRPTWRAIASDLPKRVVGDFGRDLPSAVACSADDFEACIAHLRPSLTSTPSGLLERLFVEEWGLLRLYHAIRVSLPHRELVSCIQQNRRSVSSMRRILRPEQARVASSLHQ